jgi:hypothetical protein
MRGLGLTALILLGPYTGWKLAYTTYSYRYRLTVDVLVDGEIKTGTGVIEVSATPGPAWLTGMNYAAEAPRARGEAVVVDLGRHGLLFVPRPTAFAWPLAPPICSSQPTPRG